MPAPGSPETTTRLRSCISTPRKSAAGWFKDSRETSSSRVTSQTVYRRRVAESRSATGAIAAVSRADPCNTRAWTSGCFVLRWRSVDASSRSTMRRFSSSDVGTVSPRSRPAVSRYETLPPSTKTSSTSVREQLGERAEVGDGTDHALRHRVGLAEWDRQPETRVAFVVVDRAAHLAAHLFEIAVGTKAARLDASERGDADHLVGTAIVGHDRGPDVSAAAGSATTPAATSRSARAKAPRRTRPPDHAASSTRRSAGTKTSDSGRTQP